MCSHDDGLQHILLAFDYYINLQFVEDAIQIVSGITSVLLINDCTIYFMTVFETVANSSFDIGL